MIASADSRGLITAAREAFRHDIDIATNESSIRNDTGTNSAVSNKKTDVEINDFKARVRL